MHQFRNRWLPRSLLALPIALLLPTASLDAQEGTSGEWRYWGGDAGSTRYSSLDQINAGNVANLEIAWRWSAANFGPRPETYYRATPLYANGVLYTVAGERRAAVAIDPATGETLWVWRMDEGPRWQNAVRRFSGRGLSYWTDGQEERILVATPGYRLVALDAKTGREIESFGAKGVVDLMEGLGYEVDPLTGIDPKHGAIGISSPPIIVNDVVVVGAAHMAGTRPRQLRNIPTQIRGYDVRTGKQLWSFNLIPRPGEFGNETWENNTWELGGKVGAWPPFSADPKLGVVYVPTGHQWNDYYAGHTPGDNLFSQSIVALDVKTGQRKWHFQFVHHDIWDFDTPTAPNLVDITVDGREIPAVVQTTKQGFAYVFNRVTGEPVWPIVERPVPPSTVPTEKAAPTQPFPTKPAPYELQGVEEDDLIDFTPQLKAEALELIKSYVYGPLYTPPSLANDPSGTRGTLTAPCATCGTDILGGASVDPVNDVLYVASRNGISLYAMEWSEQAQMYVAQGAGGIRGPQGLPLTKPPYGRITAIDLKTGEHLWMVANADTPDNIKNHPALQGIEIPRTGQSTHANLLTTSTLLFAGEGSGGNPIFRAHDKRTGEILHEMELPASTNAAPMTFLHEGVQYIVVAVASPNVPAELVALRLPRE